MGKHYVVDDLTVFIDFDSSIVKSDSKDMFDKEQVEAIIKLANKVANKELSNICKQVQNRYMPPYKDLEIEIYSNYSSMGYHHDSNGSVQFAVNLLGSCQDEYIKKVLNCAKKAILLSTSLKEMGLKDFLFEYV